jgi:hypothetical protein
VSFYVHQFDTFADLKVIAFGYFCDYVLSKMLMGFRQLNGLGVGNHVQSVDFLYL